MAKVDGKVARAARNIPQVELAEAGSVNVYQIVRYPVLVADKAGMEALKARLKGPKEKAE
jgi:ribosomal protein L4